MKKLLSLFLALSLLLCGCGKPESTEPTEPETEVTTAPTEEPLAAQDPEPVPSEETEPVTEPVTEPQITAPMPVSMDADTQYRINIFLSNFSEQSFAEYHPVTFEPLSGGFDAAEPDPMLLVQFCYFYNRINSYEHHLTDIEGQCYYVTFDRINENLQRFFGLTLSWEEFQNCGLDIRGDRACWPLADGDTYFDITVADTMMDLGDGTYEVEFTIYSADWEYAEAGGGITRKDIYGLSGAEAKDFAHVEFRRTGKAIVRDYENGDFKSYQLIRYQVDMDAREPAPEVREFITEDEALEIACRFWEVTPGEVDPETGFPMAVGIIQTPTDSDPVYKASVRWLVDNSHWSTLDQVTIDAYTGECRQ